MSASIRFKWRKCIHVFSNLKSTLFVPFYNYVIFKKLKNLMSRKSRRFCLFVLIMLLITITIISITIIIIVFFIIIIIIIY